MKTENIPSASVNWDPLCCANPMWGNSHLPPPAVGSHQTLISDTIVSARTQRNWKKWNKCLIRLLFHHNQIEGIGYEKENEIFYLQKMLVRDNYLFESLKLWYNKSFGRLEDSSLPRSCLIRLQKRGRGKVCFSLPHHGYITREFQTNFVI